MVSVLPRWPRRLWSDRRANVAVMTALCAVPLIGMVGLAVDYSIVLSTKTKLDAAADAAAVAAVTTAKAVVNGGGSVILATTQGSAQAQAMFKANAGALNFGANPPVPTVTWTPNGQSMVVNVSYTTTSVNQFGKIFNTPTSKVTGAAVSSTVLVPYYQFIFVVDISGSMSVGGTANDITGMNNDPNIKCAFACHDPNHNRGPDYRAYAKADGWTLKIDYVKQAVQNFITDLKTQTSGMSGVFSVGIYTYATYFNTLQSPTTNLSLAYTTASGVNGVGGIDIEPMQTLAVSQGYTRTTQYLQQALTSTTNIGDGTSSLNQATYFIFLSDGIEDIEGNQIYGRGTDVSYTSACTQMKQAGANVITIEAAYPVVSDGQYPILVAPFATGNPSAMQTAMQQCASKTSLAFMATDGPGINSAVKSALQQILQGLTRITQ